MLRIQVFLIVLLGCFFTAESSGAADWSETPAQKAERLQWWTEARFGMFIHWGLYAQAARHEWVKNREQMSNEDYQIYFDLFNPDLYNPKEWARAAKNAGMKYFVVTSKHHEGFCLWDSKYTDYKATNTPYGKDLLKPMVEAFRAEGLKVGFYYSLIDWHHPEFTIDRVHPMRNNEQERNRNADRDMSKYAEYVYNQVEELLTTMGQIDLMWLDYSYPGPDGKGRDDWQSEKLIKMVRQKMPNVIVNDRLDLLDTTYGWDFRTPEQFMPKEWVTMNGERVPWETCQTFSGSWGYHRDEESWKTPRQLVAMLIEVVSKGGNLLLNVGPTARGTFDDRAMARLTAMGEWMNYHDRAIYGCTQAPEEFQAPQNCFLTFNPELNRLYIHVMEWPFRALHLPGYAGTVKYAQLLNDASEIKFVDRVGHWLNEEKKEDTITLQLPVKQPDVVVPVIELFLK
ncbi:alpha-L-fucosidase [candidate division KSB1 bacterium]|nr:alpha-L-fucosidase [candidate division KSB1 bacterium]RQW03755.1 MAG: alpha-L-fucosidase [candidate division KSB1 bacterium]